MHDYGKAYEATTDSQGRFTFDKLPTVAYDVFGGAPAGWELAHAPITVDGDLDNVRLRLVHPLNGALKASVEFTGDSYNVGDTAHLIVSLQNTGTTDMAGIVSSCGPVGLTGTTPGWGDLAGDGVTIPAGTTKTLDVSDKVPDSARTWGYVGANCYFGYGRDHERTTHAVAHDSAPLKGVFADYKADVRNFPCHKGTGCRGNPVPGVRVVLVNEGACPIAGEGVTDANGIVTIKHIVPGTEYLAYLYPGQADWTGLPSNPVEVQVAVGAGAGVLEVGSGAARPAQPCAPASPSDVTPDAQAKPRTDELANTGVDVMGLTGLGALVLFGGAGVLAAARRRAR
ncbi:hypothetical protein [Actinocrispum sp. NPDC049592]|uniref:hypothetical protein n=1 Tax=Actinocrispum sp. NPDC049592 TaxID=3154835 RepID=UPI003428CC1E